MILSKMEQKAGQFDFSDIEVEDGENWHSQKTLSKEVVILKSLQKCMEEGSKEMTEGGIIKRIVGGQVYEIAVPNQREIFINSIKIFWSLIFPLIVTKYKDLCKEELGNFAEQHKKVVEEYIVAKSKITNKVIYKNNHNQLREDLNELKSLFEENKMDLYRRKYEFGIVVLEKENWFGERFA